LTGGSSNFGYPDATYFSRVKEELADRGLLIEDHNDIAKVLLENGEIEVK